MSHAMNAEACKTLERLGYEWKSLDGRHWDWYRTADAVPDNVASAVRLLRYHNEWRRGNKTENWEQMPYSPAELGRAIDIVCDHTTHTAQPDLLKQATEYAHDIVTWLHRDHYAENTAFQPFGDLLGLLSQIDNMICGWKESTTPAPVAKVPEGFVLVPVEPTDEMVLAALHEVDPLRGLIDWQDECGFTRVDARIAYRAMLAAAKAQEGKP